MNGLFWPGDERAGSAFGQEALVGAMIAVEAAWLAALVEHSVAPATIAAEPTVGTQSITAPELVELAGTAEAAGNPVVGFVAWLRGKVHQRDPDAARWLHRGLTSQDVLDSALMLLAFQLVGELRVELAGQVRALATLADIHRGTPMVGRTLTQPAVPITFGAKVAAWLDGLLDAAGGLDGLSFPAQFGGAAGNRSGITALGGDPAAVAASAAARLQLTERGPWHTNRTPVTRLGDALATCSAAWGRIANDVLTLSRPELGELNEPTVAGRGGSSAMPQKVNPVLSMLLRRAALTAPAHAALLHLAAGDTGDERPAGAWQVEWEPLGLLARHTLTAARQASELLAGIEVHADRMAATLDVHLHEVSAEQRSLAELAEQAGLAGGHELAGAAGRTTGPARGADDALVTAAVDRARAWLLGVQP